jgi:glutamine synthetase
MTSQGPSLQIAGIPVAGEGSPTKEVGHARPFRAADNQMKVRDAVRGVAFQHGYCASFAPKPPSCGGAHVHLSL